MEVATIRLLVPHVRMGAIIGKAGQKIKEIQESSKSRVVASEQTLPHSTDRAVAITGTPDAIYLCINQIASILEEFALTSAAMPHSEGGRGLQMYRPGALNMDARRFESSPQSPIHANGMQTKNVSVPMEMVP